ncbi:MAG: hypothetical protein ABIX28_13250 [Vicinamibacterales bacterium]
MREQVGRILATAPFRNSKRFPAFLRHTVEHALSSSEGLKERSIGHEVFGREPAYDTAQDPIVRMTAAEVRKRLTHYYQLPEHAGEPAISYQPGSYVPEFSLSAPPALDGPVVEAPLPVPAAKPRRQPEPLVPRWRVAGPAAAAAIVAVVILGAVARGRLVVPPSATDRFWAPLVTQSAPVLLCIGKPHSESARTAPSDEPSPPSRADLTVGEFLRAESVNYTDAVTLALLAGELRWRAKPFHIRRISSTALEDLRDGPVILIGGFNNPWTLRLGEGLRFTLQFDGHGPFIRDRDHPDSREWQPGSVGRLKDIRQTYGLITRVQDKSTGRAVLAVSGLVLGTRAAAECLTEPACLDSARFPGTMDWEHGNLQIVVAAAVIGENSGSPRVVVAHSW